MTTPPYLQEHGGGLVLSIKVQPRARKTELAGLLGNELKVKVTAPPVDSAANEAVLEFIANQLGLPRRCVSLQRGQTSQHKQIRIDGISLADATLRLR